MATIGELIVALGLNPAQFTAGMGAARGELAGFAATADASSKKASSSMNTAGLAMAGLAGGIAFVGIESAKSAAQFQSSMTLLQTQAGASAQEVQNMTAAVLALAPTVGLGPEQLAAGLYHVESAGYRGAKALDILKIAAEGAKVGHSDLESTTNALIAAVNSGVGGVTDMGQAMGVLNSIVGSGNMRMQDLTDAMTTGVLSSAKVFGVSIQSVGAALADMTNQGIPAIDAATKLNSAIRLMAAPTGKAAKELAGIGLSSTQLATDLRSPGGILAAVRDLQTHMTTAGLTATQQAALLATAFGGKQSLGILTLVGSLDKLGAIQGKVTAGAGDFGAAWTATEQTTAAQGEQLSASISTVRDAIGLGLLPAINSLFSAVVPVVSGLASWMAQNQGTAATILAVTGGVAALGAGVLLLGPELEAIGGVLGTILSPVALVVGGLAALAAHFGLFGKGAKDAVDGIVATIQSAIPDIVAKLADLAARFVAWVGPMIPRLIAALQGLASQAIEWIAGEGPILLAQLLTWADAFVEWIAPAIPQVLAALADFGSSILRWVLDEIPILAAGIAVMAGQLVNWILPKIPGLLADLAQFGYSLVNWILGEAGNVAGAMIQLANSAIGALVNALVADPTLIVKGIGLLLGGVLVVAAAQAAATVVGSAYTLAMKVAATLSGAIADFASAIAAAILTQLTTMAAAGGVVGTAIGVAMKIGALAAEGFGSIGAGIAGVLGKATPAVAAAATAQGTTAGAAGALSFGAALTLGLTAAAVAAVAATWAIINDGLNKQVGQIQTRLNEVVGTQTLAQLTQDKAAIGKGIADIMSTSVGLGPLGDVVYGDQLKALRAQMTQVDAQIAQVKAAAAAVPFQHDSRQPPAMPSLVAVPDKPMPSLVAVPGPATAPLGAPPTPAASVASAVAAAVAAVAATAKKTTGPSAAAAASAPVAAATAAAAQATTVAQIHLESLRVQLQTAELAANAGDAAAAQQVLVLKAEIAHQQAADALTTAQQAVTVAEAAVKASHTKLVLAQEGRIKGVNIINTSEAAYKLAQDRLTLATEKLALAKGGVALQAETSVTGAANALTKAMGNVAAAQAAVGAAQQRLADVQAGRIKGVNAAANAEVALTKAQNRLATANATLATAQEKSAAAASAVATPAASAAAATGGLVIPPDYVAAGTSVSFGEALTGAQLGGTSSSDSGLTAALGAFTAALLRAVSAGVPLTLDYETVGNLIDTGMQMNAARVTSGYVSAPAPVR